VIDNGIGMTAAVRRRLFEPFHTTKPPGQGTGLGLATSHRIVRDQGGFIAFESEPGVGTTASVYLPLSQARAERVRESEVPAPTTRTGKLLVVDDERALLDVLDKLFTERGHEVRLAASGPEAVRVLESGWRPDVILLDRSMPGWDARRTLDELRARADGAAIVYHCGQLVPDDERADVEGVIDKPAPIAELFAGVEQWIPPR
jgi:CheY-like chemotaxis protein